MITRVFGVTSMTDAQFEMMIEVVAKATSDVAVIVEKGDPVVRLPGKTVTYTFINFGQIQVGIMEFDPNGKVIADVTETLSWPTSVFDLLKSLRRLLPISSTFRRFSSSRF